MFRDCTNISFYDGWPFYRESKSNQVNDFAPLFVKAFSAPAYSQRHMICSTQNTALPQERGSSSPTYFQGAWAKTPKTRPLSFPLTLLCSTQALHPPEPPPSPISLPPSAVPQSTSHSSLVPPPHLPVLPVTGISTAAAAAHHHWLASGPPASQSCWERRFPDRLAAQNTVSSGRSTAPKTRCSPASCFAPQALTRDLCCALEAL